MIGMNATAGREEDDLENAIPSDGGLPPDMERDMGEFHHMVLTRLQDCGLYRTLDTNDNWMLTFPHRTVTDVSLKVIEKDGVKVIWSPPLPPQTKCFRRR